MPEDQTARTKLINFMEKRAEIQDRAIEELKAEVKRLEEARAKGEVAAPRYSKTWERIAVLIITGLIAIAQSWITTGKRDEVFASDAAKTRVKAERDVATIKATREAERADELYDTAAALFVAGDAEGCTFEDVEVR